ncbi:uncharacterized protein KZ484_005339 isoform 2-T2 [Pholidichthys leucotaenia]
MSVDGTKLMFEGFLQKRKDTLKIKWVTYWFRLQNTTLFFYTKKNGGASHLRGYYYIYIVQSVREVPKVENKRFMFEIIMKNGKRKMLAAETAALRNEWVGHLWQAMHLSASGVSNSGESHYTDDEGQQGRLNSNNCSQEDGVTEMLPAQPLSFPAPWDHVSPENPSPNSDDAIYQNMLQARSYQSDSDGCLDDPQLSSGPDKAGDSQGDYDVLPPRNKTRELNPSSQMDDGVYDIPKFSKRPAQHQDHNEAVYDTPSSLVRKIPDPTIGESPEERAYWRI